jgi:hypothetical protein
MKWIPFIAFSLFKLVWSIILHHSLSFLFMFMFSCFIKIKLYLDLSLAYFIFLFFINVFKVIIRFFFCIIIYNGVHILWKSLCHDSFGLLVVIYTNPYDQTMFVSINTLFAPNLLKCKSTLFLITLQHSLKNLMSFLVTQTRNTHALANCVIVVRDNA